MKLVVHYGKPKTGTTSLQHALYRARRALAAEGVLYPASRSPREDHSILTALFRAPQEMNPNVLKPFGGDTDRIARAARAIFDDIRRQVDRTRPAVLVLSSEYFYAAPTAENQERFRALLAGLSADIEICLYFREPAAQYLSGLQQALKNGRRVPPPRPTRDREKVELIERVFGRPVAAGISDRAHLIGGDIVRDFAARFLGEAAEAAAAASVRLNETISAEAMAILERYRSWRYPQAGRESIADSVRLIGMIAAIEASAGRANQPRLKPQWAADIRRASTDLLWLRDRYGLSFAEVDYAAIDGRPIPEQAAAAALEEIVEVDPARRDAILLGLVERGLRAERRGELARLGTLPARLWRKLARRAAGRDGVP